MHKLYSADDRKQAMETLLSRFRWPVEEEFMRDSFEILTDPAHKTHVIYWPRESSGQEPPFNRYLHELGHALLAESVHPQFGKPSFVRSRDSNLCVTYQPLFDASLDWFVEQLLMEAAPGFQGPDIDARFKQTAHMLRQGQALPSVEFVLDSGLALAAFQRYRGMETETHGKLREVQAAFLKTAPDKPSLFSLQSLVRMLLKVFGLHTATLVRERDFERWRIDVVKKATP